MKEPKWICTRDWARNRKGDIVENWEMKRYPPEIRNSCFKLHEEKATVTKPATRTAPISPRVDPPTSETV